MPSSIRWSPGELGALREIAESEAGVLDSDDDACQRARIVCNIVRGFEKHNINNRPAWGIHVKARRKKWCRPVGDKSLHRHMRGECVCQVKDSGSSTMEHKGRQGSKKRSRKEQKNKLKFKRARVTTPPVDPEAEERQRFIEAQRAMEIVMERLRATEEIQRQSQEIQRQSQEIIRERQRVEEEGRKVPEKQLKPSLEQILKSLESYDRNRSVHKKTGEPGVYEILRGLGFVSKMNKGQWKKLRFNILLALHPDKTYTLPETLKKRATEAFTLFKSDFFVGLVDTEMHQIKG